MFPFPRSLTPSLRRRHRVRVLSEQLFNTNEPIAFENTSHEYNVPRVQTDSITCMKDGHCLLVYFVRIRIYSSIAL